MIRRPVRAGLAVLAALFFATAAQARPPVWVVRDKDSEVVLFGSIHVLPPGLEWKPPALAQALGRADDIWFELPIDAASEAETSRLAGQRGVLPAGQSLFKILPPKDAAQLLRVAKAYKASPEVLDHLQPWLAEVLLAGAAYAKFGADGNDGVEKAIAAAVPPAAQRRAFETPAEQIDLFAAGPLPEQIASLRETMQEMEDKPDEFAILLRAWMAGDTTALDDEALAPLRKASPNLFKRLVSDRNARWAATLDQRLKGKGLTVVVVGVGHLIGKGSVPERLRALGYQVEGP
jgi:uncharacterized protein YbaP (TraB family)